MHTGPKDEQCPADVIGAAVKMGRPFKLTPHRQREAIRRRDNGEPVREIAGSYTVSHATISR